MLQPYHPTMRWIAEQQQEMIDLLIQWAHINTGSENMAGLDHMINALTQAFGCFNTEIQWIDLPLRQIVDPSGTIVSSPIGKAMRLRKHTQAPLQVLLTGYMDTVYVVDNSFQATHWIDPHTLRGPGVADMKGGLVVMLTALKALEKSPWAGKIGWEVLINPDEEIGSPGSAFLFHEAAQRNALGLVFEPAFPDGSFVSSRKGSLSYTIISHGRSAHVGRDFQQGRNALTHLARLVLEVEKLSNEERGITVNIGCLISKGPVNIVPHLAVAKINVRLNTREDIAPIDQAIQTIVQEANQHEGHSLTLLADALTPPKPFDSKIQTVFQAVKQSADALGIDMRWKPTGGACDSCRLYADGLPNIDTLGVVGGNLHTPEEFIIVDSLRERAQLTALFLMQWAAGEIQPIQRGDQVHA